MKIKPFLILTFNAIPFILFSQIWSIPGPTGLSSQVYVEYQFNKGYCKLKNGESISGYFKFSKNCVAQLQSDLSPLSPSMILSHRGETESFCIEFKMNLSGASRIIYPFEVDFIKLHDGSGLCLDSKFTKFIYSERHKKLLRLVWDGPIKFYDESFIINEIRNQSIYLEEKSNIYSFQKEYWFPITDNPNITYRNYIKTEKILPHWNLFDFDTFERIESSKNYYINVNEEFVRLKSLKNLEKRYQLRSDIKRVGITFKKLTPKHLFWMSLYTEAPSKRKLITQHFENLTIKLVNDSSFTTIGCVPPINKQLKEDHNILIFHNDSIQLIGASMIAEVTSEYSTYLTIYDPFLKKYILAKPWSYEKDQYAIGFFSTNSNLFNFNDKGEIRFYILNLKTQKWKEAQNTAKIRKVYAKQLNANNKD